MEGYSTSDAAKMVGMTPGQVSNMIFHGPIKPEFHWPDGSGDKALLGERNIKELILIRKMKDAGLRQSVIKDIIELLAKSQMEWWKEAGSYVVVIGDRWFVTDNVVLDMKRLKEEFVLLFRLD